MNKSLQNIKHFKTGSIFFRFYSLIVVLVLVLISIFSVYVYKVFITHQNEQRDAAQEALLGQISGKIDNSLLLLSENGRAIWQNPVLINAVIVPSLDKREQNFEATSFLAQNVRNLNYFDRLILHEQTADIVYASSGAVTTLDRSPELELLTACISGTDRTMLEELAHQYDVSLVCYGSEYYLVWRFIEGRNKYLGALIAKLNTDELFSGLSETLKESGYGLEIRDVYGNEVFLTESADTAGVHVREYTSPGSGFEYFLTAQHSMINAPLAYLRLTLPFIAVVLIAGLAFALFVAQRVYNPINQLLFSLPGSPEGHPEARSELDLLTASMQELQEDKEAAEAFREQVRPEIETTLLEKLLEGAVSDTEQIREQLSDIRSTLRENGKYQALIAHLPPTEGVDTVVQYMALRQIRLRIENACRNEAATPYVLRPNAQQMPVILQFDEDLSLAKCRQIYPRILNALRENELTDQSVSLTSGSIFQGLLSVPDSFREAEAALRKELYYGSGDPDDPQSAPAGPVSEQDLDAKLNRFKELYAKREMLISEEYLTQLLKELQAEPTDTDTLRSNYASILSSLHEIIIENELEQEASSAQRILAAQDRLSAITSREALYPFMAAECDAILKFLREQLSSRQQILVQQARNYIKMNYSNCDLSIHEVSESLGISDPYLSSIFTEITGETPIAYLNAYRIEIAKQLLADSRIIIKDIGYKTGFNTIQNFNRVFKRYTGMTPGEYRKLHL